MYRSLFRPLLLILLVALIGISTCVIQPRVSTQSEHEWVCFKGELFMPFPERMGSVNIGDQVICAREWKISNLHRTTRSDGNGPIYFSDLSPSE